MNDNHAYDRALIEQVDALLETGRPSSDDMVNRLAATIPQARPGFQQTLEAELLAQLRDPTAQRSTQPMQARYLQRRLETRQSSPYPLRFSLTLAAAFGALALATLIFVTMRQTTPPDNGPDTFAAAQIQATATAAVATEDSLRATAGAAESQLANAEATAQVLTELVQQQTGYVVCQFFVTTADTAVYQDPSLESPLIETLPAGTTMDVGGVLQMADGVGLWLRVTVGEGEAAYTAWTLPDTLTPASNCGSFSLSVLQPTVPPPTVILGPAVIASPTPVPSTTFTATPVATASLTFTPTPMGGGPTQDGFALTATAIIAGATATAQAADMLANATPVPLTSPTVVPTAFTTNSAATSPVRTRTDGRYELVLPVTTPVDPSIHIGDTVDILGLFNYGANGQVWARVAQHLTLSDLTPPSAPPGSSTDLLYATVIADDAAALNLIRDLASTGIPLSLAPSQ